MVHVVTNYENEIPFLHLSQHSLTVSLYSKYLFVSFTDENSTTTKLKHKRRFTIFRKNKEDKKAQGKVFGRSLTDVTSDDCLIAKPMRELLTILFREGPYTVGILRKSCNAKTLKELRQKLDDGEDCLNGESWPSLVIGALVKVCTLLVFFQE